MTHYEPGDVVLVRFPLTDLAASKKRPALVVSDSAVYAHHADVVVLGLTGQPRKDRNYLLRE